MSQLTARLARAPALCARICTNPDPFAPLVYGPQRSDSLSVSAVPSAATSSVGIGRSVATTTAAALTTTATTSTASLAHHPLSVPLRHFAARTRLPRGRALRGAARGRDRLFLEELNSGDFGQIFLRRRHGDANGDGGDGYDDDDGGRRDTSHSERSRARRNNRSGPSDSSRGGDRGRDRISDRDRARVRSSDRHTSDEAHASARAGWADAAPPRAQSMRGYPGRRPQPERAQHEPRGRAPADGWEDSHRSSTAAAAAATAHNVGGREHGWLRLQHQQQRRQQQHENEYERRHEERLELRREIQWFGQGHGHGHGYGHGHAAAAAAPERQRPSRLTGAAAAAAADSAANAADAAAAAAKAAVAAAEAEERRQRQLIAEAYQSRHARRPHGQQQQQPRVQEQQEQQQQQHLQRLRSAPARATAPEAATVATAHAPERASAPLPTSVPASASASAPAHTSAPVAAPAAVPSATSALTPAAALQRPSPLGAVALPETVDALSVLAAHSAPHPAALTVMFRNRGTLPPGAPTPAAAFPGARDSTAVAGFASFAPPERADIDTDAEGDIRAGPAAGGGALAAPDALLRRLLHSLPATLFPKKGTVPALDGSMLPELSPYSASTYCVPAPPVVLPASSAGGTLWGLDPPEPAAAALLDHPVLQAQVTAAMTATRSYVDGSFAGSVCLSPQPAVGVTGRAAADVGDWIALHRHRTRQLQTAAELRTLERHPALQQLGITAAVAAAMCGPAPRAFRPQSTGADADADAMDADAVLWQLVADSNGDEAAFAADAIDVGVPHPWFDVPFTGADTGAGTGAAVSAAAAGVSGPLYPPLAAVAGLLSHSSLQTAFLAPFGSTVTGLAPPFGAPPSSSSRSTAAAGSTNATTSAGAGGRGATASDIDVALVGTAPITEFDGAVAFFGPNSLARSVFMLQRMAEDRVLMRDYGYGFASSRYVAALNALHPAVVPCVPSTMTNSVLSLTQRAVDDAAPAFAPRSRPRLPSQVLPLLPLGTRTSLEALFSPSAAIGIRGSRSDSSSNSSQGGSGDDGGSAAASRLYALLHTTLHDRQLIQQSHFTRVQGMRRVRVPGSETIASVRDCTAAVPPPVATVSIAAVAPALASWRMRASAATTNSGFGGPRVFARPPRGGTDVLTTDTSAATKRSTSKTIARLLARSGLPTEAITHARVRVPVVKIVVSPHSGGAPAALAPAGNSSGSDADGSGCVSTGDDHGDNNDCDDANSGGPMDVGEATAHLGGRAPTAAQAEARRFETASRDPALVVCDISVNNSLGLLNSRLLRAYGRCDARFGPLVQLVKQWAQAQQLHGAHYRRLSSYAWAILVLFYLQTLPRPVLPRLQALAPFLPDHAFGAFLVNDMVVGVPRADWGPADPAVANDDSMLALLGGFFRFYASFDFAAHAVCPRLGCVLPTDYKARFAAADARHAPLTIEDPLDVTHNLARQCSPAFAAQLAAAFARAARALESELDQAPPRYQ